MSGIIANVRHLIADFVLRPASRLLGTTVALATTPRKFARQHIYLGDRRSFREAITFFASALSAAIVFFRIAFYLLGSSGFTEINYWVLTLTITFFLILVISIPLSLGRRFQFVNLLHIAAYTYGAAALVGSVLLLTTVSAVYILKSAGLISDIFVDPSSPDNYAATAVQAYKECIAGESIVMSVLLNSDIGMIAPPLQYLPYVVLASSLTYFVALIGIAADLLKRSLVLVSVVSIIGTALVIGALIFATISLDAYMSARTNCSDRMIEVANAKTLPKRLEIAVQSFYSPLVGKQGKIGQLRGVKIEDRSVLVHFEFMPADAEVHQSFTDRLRKAIIASYCGSDGEPWKLFRESGVSLVHIFRLPEGRHVGTFTVNRDECRT